jgi:hypothetical protein
MRDERQEHFPVLSFQFSDFSKKKAALVEN